MVGRGLYGPLAGRELPLWGIRMTDVPTALRDHPDIQLLRSKPNLFGRFFGWFTTSWISAWFFGSGFFPPFFRWTMAPTDRRLPEMTLGLGVITEGETRFYPLALAKEGVEDILSGRELTVQVGSDGVPAATWDDDGSRPIQVFSRWYGFAYTFPNCSILGDGKGA